jgi:hypothetical protein
MRKLLATSLCAVTMALSGCTTHKPTKVPEPIVQSQPKQTRNPANYPISQYVKYYGSRHNFTLEATIKDGYQVFVQSNGTTRLYDSSGRLDEIILKTNNFKLDNIKNKSKGVECNIDLGYEMCTPEEVKEGNRLLQQALVVTKFKEHFKYWESTDAKGILGGWRGKGLK